MKVISSWKDLETFGIRALTGEACGLGYRLLCDVTEQGKAVIEKALDVGITPAAPWNEGAIGSVMLAPEMLATLGVFALLKAGCREVWRDGNRLIGIEEGDADDLIRTYVTGSMRRYVYAGTAGSRNVHQMTGRVL